MFPICARAKYWNSPHKYIREITSFNIFKQTLFKYLLETGIDCHICSYNFMNLEVHPGNELACCDGP